MLYNHLMSTPILATKLYIPPPRPNLVRRPRLLERLNAGLHGKLTLISAPAGFGKTTLVSAWIANLRSAIYGLRADSAEEDAFVNRKPVRSEVEVSKIVMLQRQPERVRNFLLQTAMLDRLCGPLCDAVTGQADGKALLAMLERGLAVDGELSYLNEFETLRAREMGLV
ncbi:MAG: hypothetical protein R3A44_28850 [Caldilineaceae bacterium]